MGLPSTIQWRLPLCSVGHFARSVLAGLLIASLELATGCHSAGSSTPISAGDEYGPPPPTHSAHARAAATAAESEEPKRPIATESTPGSMGPNTGLVHEEPEVRIRILKSQKTLTIDCPRGSKIGPSDDWDHARPFPSSLTISAGSDGFVIATRSTGSGVSWALDSIMIDASDDAPVSVNGVPYPDTIELIRVGPDRFDVINHTSLETYLPGVIEKELIPGWQPETFRAQAIAARSYAIYEISLSSKRRYDIEAGVEDQAYLGQTRKSKALDAVHDTRGMALTYHDRILPAFFSSSSGGIGQDASAIFPGGADITPLNGRDQTRVEPLDQRKYHWGPITRDRAQLARRIAEWGKRNKNPVAGLTDIKSIVISERNDPGRPGEFTITDRSGRRYIMRAEDFRFACNTPVAGLPALSTSEKLQSSFCEVRVDGGVVHFTNGRGFGHGVGMSQYGAEVLANKGRDYKFILAYYYPGASLQKLY